MRTLSAHPCLEARPRRTLGSMNIPSPRKGVPFVPLVGLLLAAHACSPRSDGPVAVGDFVLADDTVPRVERVRHLLQTLAADSMEGREAGTAGELRAVRFLESELARYGVAPAGAGGGYRQPVVLVQPAEGDRWQRLPEGSDPDTIPGDRLRTAYNVLGVVPGTDPELAGEIVVVGAHHDHVGFGETVGGDSIYNGADDDASGSVAVLEMAREMARAARDGAAPGRTVLAAFFTAEEMGLVGTRYWIDNPTVDFDGIVANLQVEMIARPDSLAGGVGRGWLTGYERSTMGDLLAAQGSPIVPDPRPELRFFFRSDNLPFAQRGIPAHTLSSYNLHTDYHRPSDEAGLANYPHMATLVEAATAMLRELTTGPIPEWNEGGQEGLQSGG